MVKFNDLNLIPPILKALKDEDYTVPTSVQAKAIPLVLNGRDVMGSAQTGTGKTAAFALTILQHLVHEEMDKKEIKKQVMKAMKKDLDALRGYLKKAGLL